MLANRRVGGCASLNSTSPDVGALPVGGKDPPRQTQPPPLPLAPLRSVSPFSQSLPVPDKGPLHSGTLRPPSCKYHPGEGPERPTATPLARAPPEDPGTQKMGVRETGPEPLQSPSTASLSTLNRTVWKLSPMPQLLGLFCTSVKGHFGPPHTYCPHLGT